MAPVTSDLLETTRDKIKMDLAAKAAATVTQNASPKIEEKLSHHIKQVDMKDQEMPLVKTENAIVAQVAERKDHDDEDRLQKSNKIPLRLVNAHITCNICKGYLIDATTLVECLHTFCHSCIMKHLRAQDYCPKCEILVNKTKPIIKPDSTLQAIVYKLVPGLYERELLRRRAFYKMCPKEAALATPEQRGEDTEHLIFNPTENMSLSIEYADTAKLSSSIAAELKTPRYLQCPAIFRVANLKKFILLKYGIDANFLSVEIMYKVKTIVLPEHYTLMDVAYIYTWKRDAPMRFYFRVIKNQKPITEFKEKDSKPETVIAPEAVVKKEEEQPKEQQIAKEPKISASDNIKVETVKIKQNENKQQQQQQVETNNNNADKVNKMVKSEQKTEEKTESIKLKITKEGTVSIISPTSEKLSEKKPVERKPIENIKIKIKELPVKSEETDEERKKSFLNAFQLAPAKKPELGAGAKFRPIAPKPLPIFKPHMDKVSKRKNKEAAKVAKKTKVSDIKEALEKIIREKNVQQEQKESISFGLAPFPIGSKISPTKPVQLKPVKPSTSKPLLLPKPIPKPYPPAPKAPLPKVLPASSTLPSPQKEQGQKRPGSPVENGIFKKPMIIKKPEKPIEPKKDLTKKPNGQHKPSTPQHKPQNYLNYALMNSTNAKNATHYRIQRTPMYSPFSPVHTPYSPQYTPNFNMPPRPQHKYAPQSYASLMGDLQKKTDLFPQPLPPSPKKDDKPKAESLLNKLNFPSSLSVTLTTESEENKNSSPSQKNVNNYIEIVKLPEEPESPHSPPKSIIKIDQAKKPGENVQKDIISRVNEMVEKEKKKPDSKLDKLEKEKILKDSFQNKFLQSILPRLGVNEKGGAIDLFPMKKDEKSPPKKSPSPPSNISISPKASPLKTVSPKVSPKPSPPLPKAEPLKASPVTPMPLSHAKKGELRKISPKPQQQQQQLAPPPPPPPPLNPNYFDHTKFTSMFSDYARATQNPASPWPPQIAAAAAAAAFNPNSAAFNLNVMQQAYLLDQWSKMQKQEGNMLNNYMQNFQKQQQQNNTNTQR